MKSSLQLKYTWGWHTWLLYPTSRTFHPIQLYRMFHSDENQSSLLNERCFHLYDIWIRSSLTAPSLHSLEKKQRVMTSKKNISREKKIRVWRYEIMKRWEKNIEEEGGQKKRRRGIYTLERGKWKEAVETIRTRGNFI